MSMTERKAWVYLTTNLITGKKYIGQTVTPIDKRKYFGSGILIKRAIKKYGSENFERIDLFEGTENEVDLKEVEYIREFNAVESDEFYNVKEGGHHGRHREKTKKLIGLRGIGRKDSIETRQKKSDIHKGEKNAFYNKIHTEKSRLKIKEARAKQVFPAGTNQKRSETMKQKPRYQCSVCGGWFLKGNLVQQHNGKSKKCKENKI